MHNINKTLNHNFFNTIDTPEKAYILGFLICDGSIGKTHNRISFHLTLQDRYILDLFSEIIGNTNPIKTYHDENPRYKKGYVDSCELSFKSKQMKEDLNKLGIDPFKTYTSSIPNISDELMSHLCLGLLDGDGCVYYDNKTNRSSIDFMGSQKLLFQLREYLCDKLGLKFNKVFKDRSSFRLKWGNKQDVLRLGNWLYENKTNCYLIRKYNKFREIKKNLLK